MVNICLNRLHVIGPVTPLQLFTQQVAAHSPKYAPAHSLALHLIEKIERGADPLEADRELANWLDTIGAGLPRRIPRFWHAPSAKRPPISCCCATRPR